MMKLEFPFRSKMLMITSMPCQDRSNTTSMVMNRSTEMSEKTSRKSTRNHQRKRSEP